jgi:CheY-like chemotaxis protein
MGLLDNMHANWRVLVVDDNALARASLAEMLIRAGFDVTQEASGEAALAALAVGGVDAVVADIIMPGMDGIELIGRIRRHHPKVRVIAVSGAHTTSSIDYLTMASRLGADSVLAKPIAAADLVEAVERLIPQAP